MMRSLTLATSIMSMLIKTFRSTLLLYDQTRKVLYIDKKLFKSVIADRKMVREHMFNIFQKKTRTTEINDEIVIHSCGKILEYSPDAIRDEKLLPFPKAILKDVLVRWISKESGEIRDHMEVALMSLAQFQQGVGSARHRNGLSSEVLQAAYQTTDTIDAAKMISAAFKSKDRASDKLIALVEAEEKELLALIQSLR